MNPIILLTAIIATADPTPSPYPAYTGDQNLITPGFIGFAVTLLVAVATVLLIIDMTRRMRRVRYRAEVREQLEAEHSAAEADDDRTGTGAKP